MRLIAALLLLFPLPALADPVSLGYAALVALGSYGAGLSGYAILFLTITTYNTVNTQRKAKRAAAQARADFNSSLQDRNITALTAVPPLRINYGEFIGGGDIIDILTSDKQEEREYGSFLGKPSVEARADAYKHLVIHLASHEIQSIDEVYLDGVAVGALDTDGWATQAPFGSTKTVSRSIEFTTTTTLDDPIVSVLNCYEKDATNEWILSDVTPTLTVGNTVVTVPTGKTVRLDYTRSKTVSTVRIRKFLGTDTQSVESYLTEIAPNTDSTNHHLRGLAVVVITLDLEEPRFQGGATQITVARKGKKLYDPRTGTTAYSKNPALCVRDFLTGYYGYDCDASDIDDAYTIAAANACDETITLIVNNVSTRGPRYTCNGQFTTDQGLEAVLADLSESMAGFAPYGAKYMIQAGAWSPPVSLPGGGGLTDDDLSGEIEVIQAGPGVDELYNGCRAVYIPSDTSITTDAEPYQNSTFVTADGRELWLDFALPFTDNAARAKNLLRIFTERSRYAQIIRFPANLRAWPLRVGDRVEVTNTEYSFSRRVYRVTDWQFGITSPVVLTLELDDPSVYDTYDASVANVTANANLPDPWDVADIVFTATSSTDTMVKSGATGSLMSRVVLTWDEVTDPLVKTSPGYIEIQWRRGNKPFERMTWPGNQTEAELLGVNHDDRLVIRIRAVNGLGGKGNWTHLAHTVDGPTTVGTVELDGESATAIRSATATNVSITGRSGVPNTPTARWTQIATISYTPDVSGEVILHGSGEMACITASSGSGEDIATMATCLDAGTITTDNIQRFFDVKVGFSETVHAACNMTRRFSVTGGVAYTFSLRGQGSAAGGTITATQAELRMEFIKR